MAVVEEKYLVRQGQVLETPGVLLRSTMGGAWLATRVSFMISAQIVYVPIEKPIGSERNPGTGDG
jgi:hypothetical protein